VLVAQSRTPGQGLNAIVYNDKSCEGCVTAMKLFLSGLGFSTKVVSPRRLADPDTFEDVAVYAQPGGDDTLAISKSVGSSKNWSAAKTNLRDFVEKGGTYLGVCLGGYMAGTDESAGAFGLIPAAINTFTKTPYRYTKDQILTIRLKPTDKARRVYFQEGPALPRMGTVYATYSDGTPAMIATRVGSGNVVLSGIHFEATDGTRSKATGKATDDWYEDALGTDSDGTDADLGLRMMQDALSGNVSMSSR
jgi:hypothetical protein